MPWIKSLHLLFVMAWMSALFYLPRILVHYVEGRAAGEDVRRLAIMGRKLYRFGHVMMGLAILLGTWLWLGYGIGGGWLHAKLALVVVLIAYFTVTGRWLKRAERGASLPGPVVLRWFNELPVLVLFAILALVLMKPF